MKIIKGPPQLLVDDSVDLDGAVDVVLLWWLNQTEPVHVTHVGLSFGPQQVKPAHVLLESSLDRSADLFFFLSQVDRVSHFFSIDVPLHYSVERGALPGFSMGIIFSDCVDLDIKAICWQELFVNVRARLSDWRLTTALRNELPRIVVSFPEKYVVSRPTRIQRAIVYLDLVILCV